MLPAPLQQRAAAASTSKAATSAASSTSTSTSALTAPTAAVAVRSSAPRAAALPAAAPAPRQAALQSSRIRKRAASGLAAGVSGREAVVCGGMPVTSSWSSPSSASPFDRSASALSPRSRRRSRRGPAPPASSSSPSPPSSSPSPEGTPSPSSAPAEPAPAPSAEKTKQQKRKWSGLARRAASGVALGAGAAATIALGGWVLCVVACLIVYQASVEYYGLVTSQGLVGGAGMTPPTRASAAVATWCCVGIAVWTHLSRGKVTAALAVASFIVLSVSLLGDDGTASRSSSPPSSSSAGSGRPRFAQLTSSVFGLFYCGYLPSFWIKLRLLSAPAAGAAAASPALLAAHWPAAFGGPTAFTVGLAATLLSVVCVIAADTGAYFTGKSVGRTQLTPASPKKTVEGAAGGLASAVAAALLMRRLLLGWPADGAVALSLGVLAFGASLFGDLVESVIKRDAGLKDAGDLIPGHGGLLDRFDSYIFTGAIVFFVIRFVLPVFGL